MPSGTNRLRPARRQLSFTCTAAGTVCSLDTHRGLAARLALAGGSPLLLLDYRLAPEHPFPAAPEDALTAYRWLLAVAAARLSENIPELEGWLVKQVQRRLRED